MKGTGNVPLRDLTDEVRGGGKARGNDTAQSPMAQSACLLLSFETERVGRPMTFADRFAYDANLVRVGKRLFPKEMTWLENTGFPTCEGCSADCGTETPDWLKSVVKTLNREVYPRSN